jgi:MFS family permease
VKDQAEKNKARIVLAACVLFNVSIGVLYAWSVLKSKLTAPVSGGGYGWSSAQAGFPYVLAIGVLSVAMLIGGRIQDKIGPRLVVRVGGTLVGLGLILSGLVGNSVMGITMCFGIISGIGTGFGYSCATPPALKWFHPSKKGLVSGLIVGGFGLSAVFYAPLTNALLSAFGIEKALVILGTGALVLSVFISLFIDNPPPGYVPETPAKIKQSAKSVPATDAAWNEMIKTRRFCMIFLIFLLGSSVGLMVIGSMTKIAEAQVGIRDSAILAVIVSFLAVVNTLGRVAGGQMSDKIGRINSLFVVLILQMLNMAAFTFYRSLPALFLGIVIVGFCFGSLLSIMPVLCADLYGIKNFGFNYGILFLAWGSAGVIAPTIADFFYDATGAFNATYMICAVMMGAMIFVNFLLKKDIEKR